MRVTVGIPTFRRPDALTACLASVAALHLPADVSVDVVVVDNDPGQSARATVDQASIHGAPVRYASAPTRGYSEVRNRALAEARGSDALAFVDDDEVVAAGWLHALVEASEKFDADIVTGPVLPVFESVPRKWVGAALTRGRHITGTVMPAASGNNLLLRLDRLEGMDFSFSPAFNETGGEDTEWSERLVAGGATIVWADDAIVHEPIAADRLERRWVLRRSLRNGNILGRVRLSQGASRGSVLIGGIARAGRSALGLDVASTVRGIGMALAGLSVVLT